MRCVIGVILALSLLVPASAAPPRKIEFTSSDTVLAWINAYRQRPEPARLPAAVRALSTHGAIRDVEAAGVYVGFVAGVLGGYPEDAEDLIAKMFPLPAEDHWLIVRAIAYSGLPDWKELMAKVADRMPARKAMMEKYIDGKLPTLLALAAPKQKSSNTKKSEPETTGSVAGSTSGSMPSSVTWAIDASPELLDTHWGYYFATGDYGPIVRIVAMLKWSTDKDNVEKLTMGQMAKYTLAKNATRDSRLLDMLRRARGHQDKETVAVLKEIIEAAETVETGRIRKDALAAIEELKRKGPGSKREALTWGRVGEGAIALGCIGAAVAGAIALGLPCVVGGAVTSAALRGLATP